MNVTIPYLNPVKYHKLTPDEVPQYVSRHFERWREANTIRAWFEQVEYAQIWQKTDVIKQQILSDFEITDEVYLQLIEADRDNDPGTLILSTTFSPVLQNVDNPGEWVYEKALNLSNLQSTYLLPVDPPDGLYFLKIVIGAAVFISEPQLICESIENSLLLEYKHREYKGLVFFETGILFQQRVLGTLRYKNPAAKDTLYEDQELDETLLSSEAFDVYELIIGGSWGIPDYLVKRLNRIFSLSYKAIDGTQYEKNEGARFELKEIDGYPLKGLRIELREAEHSHSQSYEI
jgi:hypothetical protein